MTIYKNRKLRSIILSTVLMFISLWANLSVSAEETIRIYNRNEEVILSHEPVYYNEQYFIHFDDLSKLDLEVTKEETDNSFDYTINIPAVRYNITATDYLGTEKQVIIDAPLSSGGGIVTNQETGDLTIVKSSTSKVISFIRYSGSIYNRYTKIIGETNSSFINPDMVVDGTFGDLIRVNDEYYMSTEIIGNRLSHKYSFENGRMDFYIANTDSVIMETTVKASSRGNDVKIYTAYKTGEGNTLDDFEILSSVSSVIPENEILTCKIDTPAEKISDKNIYFIVDLGERYDLIYKEYDFSKVGNVLVYAEAKDCTYTVNITMPEIEEIDIPFTVYVDTDTGTFSKQGVIKSGEEFCKFEFEGLPASQDIKAWIEFGYHKYRNAVLEEFMRVRETTTDFDTDFTPAYSDKVICNVKLPDGFVPEGNVETRLSLSKYMGPGDNYMCVVDELRDWSYGQTVILNNEKRSEQVTLYWQSSSTELSYGIRNGGVGLCKSGCLGFNGKTVSNDDFSMEIEEEMTVELILLKQKNVTVVVCRPDFNNDKDIFGTVIFDDKSTSVYGDIVKNFTQTPLIPAGQFSSHIEITVPEDVVYTLEVTDITGDENVYDYCCLANPYSSSASGRDKGIIHFSLDSVELKLLGCNTITGTIECEDMGLDFEAFAICDLYNDDPITVTAEVENGGFVLKIPDDTDTFIFGVQTKMGKKSYYVSDGVSTNNQDEATEISFRFEDDKKAVLKYIVQKPSISVEYNKRNENFAFKNNSDYLIENIDLYLSYYGENGKFISSERKEVDKLESGEICEFSCNASDYKIVKVKAFALERNGLKPLGNSAQISANTP